jgi:glycosyltransferase involved in cell wall biosynthesis
MCTRMREAHVLLLPSFYEGFPITVLEAMAAGCVPIVSRLPGITDRAVVDGESGFLESVGDSEAFAARVAELDRDTEHLARMSAAAMDRARAHFGVEDMGARYDDLIHRAREGAFPLGGSRRELPSLDRELVGPEDYRIHGLRAKLRHRWRRLTGGFD